MTEIQEIALRLLAAQRDVIWSSEDKRAEAIAAALDTARMFLDISREDDE